MLLGQVSEVRCFRAYKVHFRYAAGVYEYILSLLAWFELAEGLLRPSRLRAGHLVSLRSQL